MGLLDNYWSKKDPYTNQYTPSPIGMGLLNFGGQLMANSGPSLKPMSFMGNVGQAMPAFSEGYYGAQQMADQGLDRQMKLQDYQDRMRSRKAREAFFTSLKPVGGTPLGQGSGPFAGIPPELRELAASDEGLQDQIMGQYVKSQFGGGGSDPMEEARFIHPNDVAAQQEYVRRARQEAKERPININSGNDSSNVQSVINTADGAFTVRRDGSLVPLMDKTGKQIKSYVADPTLAGEKKYETEMGEARADAKKTYQKVAMNSAIAKDALKQLKTHPGREFGLGVKSYLPNIRGTDRAEFEALRDQAQGQVFLQAFESLKGGGHITEIEGQKATEALARLKSALTQEAFDSALSDLEWVIDMGLARAKSASEGNFSADFVTPSPSQRQDDPLGLRR